MLAPVGDHPLIADFAPGIAAIHTTVPTIEPVAAALGTNADRTLFSATNIPTAIESL